MTIRNSTRKRCQIRRRNIELGHPGPIADKAKLAGVIQRSAAARNPRTIVSLPRLAWLDRRRP